MSDVRDLVRIQCDVSVTDTIMATLAGRDLITATIFLPEFAGGETYEGEYLVIPKAHEQTILATNGKLMADDVTVVQIPYYETSNLYGKTAYIASEV